LSADSVRPEKLFQKGLSQKPFLYARGRVVLWSNDDKACRAKAWKSILIMSHVRRIAMANPETAPYGEASLIALKRLGLFEMIQKKLVYAQNVTQAFQYAHTGSVDAGFCALSSARTEMGKQGCSFFVDDAPPIIQKGCILNRSKKLRLSFTFEAFLNGLQAREVKNKFGYD
jgi:molybdate transport system substrate-binding protein